MSRLDDVRARAAALGPGTWHAGIELGDDRDNYWCPTDVYWLDADPIEADLPAYGGTPTEDEDVRYERQVALSKFADEHERGIVAATHNWASIPEEQHDAIQRFIANARQDVPWLLDLVDRLAEALTATDDYLGQRYPFEPPPPGLGVIVGRALAAYRGDVAP